MKKSRVIEIFNFLNTIKISKISDKEVRNAIISNHLAMYKIAKEHNEEIQEVQKKLFEGKEAEIQELNDLRQQYKEETDNLKKQDLVFRISNECSDILALEKEFNDMFVESLNTEINVNIKKVSQEKFVEACVEADVEITTGDLIVLTDLFVEDNE